MGVVNLLNNVCILCKYNKFFIFCTFMKSLLFLTSLFIEKYKKWSNFTAK